MGDLKTGYSYEIQRQELELKNEQDTLARDGFQLKIAQLEYDINKIKLDIAKVDERMEERNKQINWLNSKING